jgi:hypothetical protein
MRVCVMYTLKSGDITLNHSCVQFFLHLFFRRSCHLSTVNIDGMRHVYCMLLKWKNLNNRMKDKKKMQWSEKNKTKAISECLGITVRTVQKTTKHHDVLEDMNLLRKAGSGRPRKTGELVAKALRRSETMAPLSQQKR